jgi:lipoate---protein ligase
VSATWSLSKATGTAAELHAWEPDASAGRVVRATRVTRPAVVLGSTQPDTVDRAVAARLGADVGRRRSGGGAVWVAPDDPLWVDVVVPAGDPLWEADIGRSFLWLGRCWSHALDAFGMEGGVVHDGALVRSPLSDAVCFAGLGSGEVTVDGRKVVGIAQRRTRTAAWFQCAVPIAWDPAPLAALLRLDPADLAGLATGVAVPIDQVLAAFVDVLPGDLAMT